MEGQIPNTRPWTWTGLGSGVLTIVTLVLSLHKMLLVLHEHQITRQKTLNLYHQTFLSSCSTTTAHSTASLSLFSLLNHGPSKNHETMKHHLKLSSHYHGQPLVNLAYQGLGSFLMTTSQKTILNSSYPDPHNSFLQPNRPSKGVVVRQFFPLLG
jgi:hypothetical protein